MILPHLAARLFGTPLLIHRAKLDVILAVLGSRVGVQPPAHLPDVGRFTRMPPTASSPVAVLPIHGTLVRRTVGLEVESGLTSYTTIAQQLDAAMADPQVAGILLDIDSPGGEAGGVFDLAERIGAAAQVKPVWALANDMAFSAAYALAAGASRLVVSRTGGVGSVGVIAMHVDQSLKDAQDGLRYTPVFAGAHKNDLNPHAPLTDAAQAVLQAEVDRIYKLFVTHVARQRGLTADVVRATQAGLFFGPDAITAGLADAVGSFDDTLAQLQASLAPRPRLVGGSASTSLYPPLETSMPDQPDSSAAVGIPDVVPARVAESTAPSVDAVAVPAAPVAENKEPVTAAIPMAISDAIVIAETCQLAGRTDLIAGFLEAAATPTEVRRQLLAAHAAQAPEIASRIDPNGPGARPVADPLANTNPLLQAVKQRLAQTTVPKP